MLVTVPGFVLHGTREYRCLQAGSVLLAVTASTLSYWMSPVPHLGVRLSPVFWQCHGGAASFLPWSELWAGAAPCWNVFQLQL